MEQVKVSIKDQLYSVIGDEFWEMLERVKNIPGRQYIQNAWRLPGTLDEARASLAPLRVVNDDELLEAEIKDIQRVQARILELRGVIEKEMNSLSGEVSSYSYGSKSRIKAGKAVAMGRLGHALDYASMPVEQLTDPQIKTLYAALRDIEG